MSLWKKTPLWRVVSTWRGGVSMAVLVLIALAAIFAPWVAPYPYDIQTLSATNKEPSMANWLGTDEFGRDVLSRIIYGARTSLTVALTAICGSVSLGMCLGAAAAYFGGLFDRIVTAAVDLTWSFPEVLIALIFVAILGAGLYSTMVAIGIAYLAQFTRLTRAQILTLKSETYVEAAVNLGAGHFHILFRHLLPGFSSHIIVVLTMSVPTMVLGETSLSFLGLGLRPPIVSWGVMLKECESIQTVANYPWLLLPVVLIVLTVLCFNFLGDGLRDAADPYSAR